MSYDVMAFDPSKAPCTLDALRPWLEAQMERDACPESPTEAVRAFAAHIRQFFPPMARCPEDQLDDACEYSVHEGFIYMSFAYSAAQRAHDVVKRQARLDGLGFWDVSQEFDRAFPVTLPTDRWPMLLNANWGRYGAYYVYRPEDVLTVLRQMQVPERSSACLTDRFGNYIQTGGYGDTNIVEVRRYTAADAYRHRRADQAAQSFGEQVPVPVNGFSIHVPASQVFTQQQVCALFEAFMTDRGPEDACWKELAL